MTPGLPWWHGAYRTCGVLPVAEHLRPTPMQSVMADCPIYTRLAQAANRSHWRRYDLSDFIPVAEARAVPVAGEA